MPKPPTRGNAPTPTLPTNEGDVRRHRSETAHRGGTEACPAGGVPQSARRCARPFEIRRGLPKNLAAGVFGQRRSYHVWVRFSSDTTPTTPDLRTTLGIGGIRDVKYKLEPGWEMH